MAIATIPKKRTGNAILPPKLSSHRRSHHPLPNPPNLPYPPALLPPPCLLPRPHPRRPHRPLALLPRTARRTPPGATLVLPPLRPRTACRPQRSRLQHPGNRRHRLQKRRPPLAQKPMVRRLHRHPAQCLLHARRSATRYPSTADGARLLAEEPGEDGDEHCRQASQGAAGEAR